MMDYPYSHERVLRLRMDKEDYLEKVSAPVGKKKNNKLCPKLKGEHDFIEVPWIHSWCKKQLWHEFRCTGCNKKKIEFKKAGEMKEGKH